MLAVEVWLTPPCLDEGVSIKLLGHSVNLPELEEDDPRVDRDLRQKKKRLLLRMRPRSDQGFCCGFGCCCSF